MYELLALRSGRYAEAGQAALSGIIASDPEQRRTAEVLRRVYAALVDPSQRPRALEARAALYPQASGQPLRLANVAPCLQSSYAYALLGELDVAYDLANQCLNSRAGAAVAEDHEWLWQPALRRFRQDPRFQPLVTRLGLMAYWQRYGAPDQCTLASTKLTCD